MYLALDDNDRIVGKNQDINTLLADLEFGDVGNFTIYKKIDN